MGRGFKSLMRHHLPKALVIVMRAIFIVGTGRSGTHFTVRLLNGFANSNDPMNGSENPSVLYDIAKAAIHHRLPSESTTAYYRKMLNNSEGIVLDQHHPNLFFVRHWSEIFEDLIFLYPMRPAHQVVASMLRHKGVMGWYDYAKRIKQRTINRIPYPNRFLGLDHFSDIRTLPQHLLCAHRVFAHRRAFESTFSDKGNVLRGVKYEELVKDPAAEFSRVFSPDEMAALGPFTLVEKPKIESLAKYRDVLSDEQVAEIVALEAQFFPN